MSFVIEFEVVDPTAISRAGPKRKRASKPKVRSGCRTCKIRKLKCDEGRPGCQRCAGLKVECGGYDHGRSSQLIQERVVSKYASAGLDDIVTSPLAQFPVELPYGNQQEYQYFNYFTENTGLQLWLNFTPRIWKSLLEQCCSIEPSLRQLIISVGALGKTSEPEASGNSHVVFARRQYSKALKGFQDFITRSAPGGTSTRIILLASLMIFCFEAQHGEFKAAIRNVRTALAVLREDFAAKKVKYKHINRPLPIPEAEYEMLTTLVRLDQGFVGYSTEVADADDKGAQISNLLDFSYVKDTFEIPSFSNLSEARAYLSLIESRTIRRVAQFMQDQGDLDFRLPCPLLSVELFNEISLDLKHWATSFAPLYSREWDYDSLDFFVASFICIQALSSDLTLRGMHFGEMGLRTKKVEKLADRIVNVAKLIVSNRRFHRKFTCETGVIAALCSVVFVCRDRDIRWSAVEVIRSTVPRREGVWDSVQTLQTCEEVLNHGEDEDMPFLVFRSQDAFALRFGRPPATVVDEMASDAGTI